MAALASRSAFFAPLAADDAFGDAGRAESGASQAATWGEAELVSLAGALCPGSRAALPAVLRVLGEIGSEPRWGSLFEGAGLLHAFAVAHLLGAADLLDAARDEWAVACERSLAAVLVAVDAEADAACLRTAADHGLDMRRPLKLLHAAAIADAAAACQAAAPPPPQSPQRAPGASFGTLRPRAWCRTVTVVSRTQGRFGCAWPSEEQSRMSAGLASMPEFVPIPGPIPKLGRHRQVKWVVKSCLGLLGTTQSCVADVQWALRAGNAS